MSRIRFSIFFVLMLLAMRVVAQSDPAITAENIARLQSVAQIDFADTGAEFTTGWFAMSPDGSQYAASAGNAIYTWSLSETGAISAADSVDTGTWSLLDVLFSAENQAVGVFNLGEKYQISSLPELMPLHEPAAGLPLSMWLHRQDTWLELISPDVETGTVIVQYPALLDAENTAESVTTDYAPAGDADAIVRIGRVTPPYVVTSSETGRVKLWNLETGAVLAEVDNGTGGPAVFGNINAAGTHLVWRDEASENLYLLDFATGNNQKIADLNGEYVQWFFLSPDASVILAVNQNFEPAVSAWDVATGERTVLGAYRACTRPQPDMARLSPDGTTLVIGCDTGLDIWRIR